jgi:rhodanese-related sulfurtransferase
MNFDNPATVAAPKFNALIKGVPSVYNDLGSAHLIVFYCQYGQSRSPAMAGLYMKATADVTTRPETYNANQRVVVLDGGMDGYEKNTANPPTPPGRKWDPPMYFEYCHLTTTAYIVTDWLPPTSGKVVAGGKGSGKVVQLPTELQNWGGGADEWDVMYTEP